MKIKLKRSDQLNGGTALQPQPTDLDYGELAVNYAASDPTIFLKDSADNVIQIAGANALTQVPTLDQVTDQGNWSSDSLLVGGPLESPTLQLNNTGNVITTGYFRSNKDTATDVVFETELDSVISFKAMGSGSLALGGTISAEPSESEANIFLNAQTGKVSSSFVETSGTITSGGQLIASAGASLSGTVTCNNNLNVTENTALTGTLDVTGVATLASLNASYYDLSALDALPE